MNETIICPTCDGHSDRQNPLRHCPTCDDHGHILEHAEYVRCRLCLGLVEQHFTDKQQRVFCSQICMNRAGTAT